MKGSYSFRVKSKKVIFEFTIKRNITVIKGDSATGKTTLLHMLYEYLRVGNESGYSVATNASYFVYLRKEVGRSWQDAMGSLKNTIIFIEENNDFVFGEEFAAFVKHSGNYFVIVNRAPLKMLPYSIHEIYEIVTSGKHVDVKESYHEFHELYSNYPMLQNNKLEQIVTEDGKSGYQFFRQVFHNSCVTSAYGNSNIVPELKKRKTGDTLVIADGAAFGAMMEDCIEHLKSNHQQRVSVWLPESFEYLILKSGLIQTKELEDILQSPSEYVDSEKYVSWERFFTELLISLTANTPYSYSKEVLQDSYLQKQNMDRIVEQFPKELRPE